MMLGFVKQAAIVFFVGFCFMMVFVVFFLFCWWTQL